MNTLYGLGQNRKSLNPLKPIGKNGRQEVLADFNALTLKEKCLYLIKISKRNTEYQTIVVTGLTLLAMAVDYLI